jgi:hypothetical protein
LVPVLGLVAGSVLAVPAAGAAPALAAQGSPAPDAPAITAPAEGENLPAGTPVVSGTGQADAQVAVADEAGHVLCTATVDGEGSWSCVVEPAMPAGEHWLNATQADGAGTASAPSAWIAVLVASPPVTPVIAVSPALKGVYGRKLVVPVTVAGGAGGSGGQVQILSGEDVVASAPVIEGVANVSLPEMSIAPGLHILTASYSGDEKTEAGSVMFPVGVAKCESVIVAEVSPDKVKAGRKRATLWVAVTGESDVTGTGSVQIRVPDQGSLKVPLRGGEAQVKLRKFPVPGTQKIRIRFPGSAYLMPTTVTRTVKIIGPKHEKKKHNKKHHKKKHHKKNKKKK